MEDELTGPSVNKLWYASCPYVGLSVFETYRNWRFISDISAWYGARSPAIVMNTTSGRRLNKRSRSHVVIEKNVFFIIT